MLHWIYTVSLDVLLGLTHFNLIRLRQGNRSLEYPEESAKKEIEERLAGVNWEGRMGEHGSDLWLKEPIDYLVRRRIPRCKESGREVIGQRKPYFHPMVVFSKQKCTLLYRSASFNLQETIGAEHCSYKLQ